MCAYPYLVMLKIRISLGFHTNLLIFSLSAFKFKSTYATPIYTTWLPNTPSFNIMHLPLINHYVQGFPVQGGFCCILGDLT